MVGLDHLDIISTKAVIFRPFISPSQCMIFNENSALADVIQFLKNMVDGPLINTDDMFTRWSIRTEPKHVLMVCEALKIA